MAKLSPKERAAIAERRLLSVLGRHGIATMRTLEQKISDAGPNDQRIDPHVLTEVRNVLMRAGRIDQRRPTAAPWYFLTDADPAFVKQRLAHLEAIHRRVDRQGVKVRIGQTLEIAVYRALKVAASAGAGHFIGDYPNLEEHDDATPYRKEEPLSISGRRAPQGKSLDFIAVTDSLGAGLEVKNIREWIYPNRIEVKDLILKALALDVVPVLIARRIHFSAFSVLTRCGVVLHQTYNQLYPTSEAALAADAKHKDNLGFHDIRVGNEPDARLVKFVRVNLPKIIRDARSRFDTYRDLLADYAAGHIDYPEFSGRSRRRSRGEPEDGDPPWEQEADDFDEY